jgi:hypothetical protein
MDGILASLLEKKDLLIYIDMRIAKLKRFNIKSIPIENRERVSIRLNGRIRELEQLKEVISMNRLKKCAILYWRQDKQAKEEKLNENTPH